jgi:4-alpha-glucanotransferase
VAASVGLDLVQILPVQDTGSDASPYAARTAFGLHPLHLRLDELEGAERFAGELATVRRALAHAGELEYADVAGIKREFARRIFDRLDHARLWKELEPWIEANPWMRAHAVYAVMRERHGERSWRHWPQLRDPREKRSRTILGEPLQRDPAPGVAAGERRCAVARRECRNGSHRGAIEG